MIFDENAIVRYLLREMDPSEERLFEQRMNEDENLLIDVESLRAVYQRISTLKPVNPPKHVSRNVLMQASRHLAMHQRRKQRSIWMTAAATLLVLFVGGTWLLGENRGATDVTGGIPVEAGTGAVEVMTVQPVEVTGHATDPSGAGESASRVTPWVDRNEELHFLDRFDQQNADRFDSLLYQSMDRLKPLQQRAVQTQEPTGGLHLTGQ
ncbi:MAG: hypothetical protein WEA36_06555 [Balneolaceae bacterium]